MKKFLSSIALASSFVLTGCVSVPASNPVPFNNVATVKQGTVIGVQNATMSVNDPNLAGAAIGGIAGGLIGNQFGKGNGRKALTILGALGGATAGSQYNSQRVVQGYAITIRGYDREVFTFNSKDYLAVGQHVNYTNYNNKVTIY